MHPLRGLCHEGGHSLSESLHLLPQGPQTLSPIEEIQHCHRGPGVCLWEGSVLQLGMDDEAPPQNRPAASTCRLCPARTGDLVPQPSSPDASTSSQGTGQAQKGGFQFRTLPP